jgi:hypothetical protein
MGSIGQITGADELDALEKFREEIADIEFNEYPESHVLLPWLRAHQLDIKNAGTMLRNSMEWRKSMDMDGIFEWKAPEDFVKTFPYNICGFDNDGDQFGVVTWQKWDIQSFLDSVQIDRGEKHIKFFFQQLEIVKKIMKEHSTDEKIITSGALIVDMEGLAMTQFASKDVIEVILAATQTYEANYPGFLKKAIVVNAPKIFTILWSLMKPLLSEATLSTVEIYGFNSDEWKPFLKSFLPVDQIPSRYGGSNTSGQPYNPKDGFKIPPVVFEEFDESEMTTATVLAAQKLDLEYEIVEPGSKMSWSFKSDDYDVAFGVFFNEVELTDFSRVDSHILTQKGQLTCQEAGKYILRFDNTFSWFCPKTFRYAVKIVPPS